MKFRDRAAIFLATGMYIGFVPVMPGTFGSLLGIPLIFLQAIWPLGWSLFFMLLFIGVAVAAAHRAEKIRGTSDPGCIVIDEIAGMAVTLVGLPITPVMVVAGFILFRALDILKPPPIRTIDKNVSGGLGVVMDDVVAGIAGNILLRLVLAVAGPIG